MVGRRVKDTGQELDQHPGDDGPRQRSQYAEIVLEVRDTGPGIPNQLLDRAFERFVRLSASDGEGSGLGLPIVRAIAERSGLRVTLRNRTDRSGLVARVAFSGVHLA